MNNTNWEGLDEIIRDLTKAGGMAKSEARSRLQEILDSREQAIHAEYEGKIEEARKEHIHAESRGIKSDSSCFLCQQAREEGYLAGKEDVISNIDWEQKKFGYDFNSQTSRRAFIRNIRTKYGKRPENMKHLIFLH